MEGLIVRGRLVRLELPEGDGGFANVTVEAHRFDGEPKWMRMAYPVTKQNSTEATRIAIDLMKVALGSVVEIGCEARVGGSGRLWIKAHAVEVVALPDGSVVSGGLGDEAARTNGRRVGATA